MSSMLSQYLTPERVRLRLGSNTKNDLIRELLNILDEAALLNDPAEVERVVFERELELSTGLTDGIALPHGKTDTVEHLLIAMGLKPEGMDFESLDGQPARIFIFLISPASDTGPHVQCMAEIAKLLSQAELRQRILEAETPEEVVECLTSPAATQTLNGGPAGTPADREPPSG